MCQKMVSEEVFFVCCWRFLSLNKYHKVVLLQYLYRAQRVAGIVVRFWQAVTTFLQGFEHASHLLFQGMLQCLLVITQRAADFFLVVWQEITNSLWATEEAFMRWTQEIVDRLQSLHQSIRKHLPSKPTSWVVAM